MYLSLWELGGACWNISKQSEPPKMRRMVLRSSIIQARGSKCPIPLSSFAFYNTCFFNDANKGKAGGCYRIRQLPLDSYVLIHIDANLTEKCPDCPDFII
uniref:Uncharacterized protein n=1 Tax=Parascaris equorum TaxID=6256 RepID=A0A914REV8_PAREQ